MSYPIIDTHTHLYFDSFDENRLQVIQDCRDAKVVQQVQIGCDEVSSLAAIALARKESGFFATIGLHPCDVADLFEKNLSNNRIKGFEQYKRKARNLDELFSWFENLYKQNTDIIVGIGETGFDRYHDTREMVFDWQNQSFLSHLELAEACKLPLIIHSRAASHELIGFMKKNIKKNLHRGVVHCFAEDTSLAKILTQDFGFFLGIGGVVTFDNAKKLHQAIIETPLEYLVTETDSPFLAPKQFKKNIGRINNASSLREVVQKIADLKNLDEVLVGETLFANGQRLFGV